MIDSSKRLAVIIPTHNNIRYLKLCLEGLAKNSTSNLLDVHIHFDGCTDGSQEMVNEFIASHGMIRTTESEQRGMYSAVNTAFEYVNAPYFILINDDVYVGPGWDEALLNQCRPSRVLCPRMVEPIDGGSYPPKFDAGTTPETFEKTKFERYAKELAQPGLKLDTIGMWSFSSGLFREMNGLDETFDPFGCGGLELLYRIRVLHWSFEFRMLLDSIIYHFSKACKRENKMDGKSNSKAWYEKYTDLEIQDANDLLEGRRNLFPFEKTEGFRDFMLEGHENCLK